ncbi:MAG TPA: serine hydrolase domain-containing protein [Candidatus Limnocylindrales bacterium]|nr:serine hydrolase domain-containing protein [Candidatus Limnocylindrales bacterium]
MGRHPDRRSASRALAIVLCLALGSWAAIAATAAVSRTLVPGVAAGSTEAPGVSASAVPSARSAAPASADASTPPVPAATPAPTPVPPPADRPPLARPRVTTAAIGDRLQAELDAARQRLGIPGVSATVILRDGTIWTGHSGLADVGNKVPVANDTAFALGSVSKTYTAALILALAGDGAIDLDAPAATYIPERGLDQRITVRMLLDHTSGLDDYFLHASIDKALQSDRGATWSTRRTLRFVAKPYFAPGTGWHYSNTNYLYLGLIAERVTNEKLGIALNERFFAPLGLDATWYQAAEEPRAPTAHGYQLIGSSRSATPIDLSDGTPIVPFTSVVTAAAGAGSIAATSADVAEWARLLYTGKVLGPDLTAEMLGGVTATAGYRPRVPYGLGVQAFSIDGRPTVGHSGRLLGFRAAVRHLPGEGTTVAVLTNQSRADPGAIVERLLSVVFAPEPDCLRCRNPS